jgi:hypothetical protein
VGAFGMLGFTTKETKVGSSFSFPINYCGHRSFNLSLLVTLFFLPVSQLPSLGRTYKHVGMEIRLRRKQAPVVDYPTTQNWRQARQNMWDFITSLPEVLKYHSCDEMLTRIRRAEPAMRATSLQDEYQHFWALTSEK